MRMVDISSRFEMPGNSHPSLSPEMARELESALCASSPAQMLSDHTRATIKAVCSSARQSLWTPEQLVVAVKQVSYSAPEFAQSHSPSERQAIIARIVTACIREFYRAQGV